MRKFINDLKSSCDNVLPKLLLENDKLIIKFIENFEIYQNCIKEKLKDSNEIDPNNITFDGFSHQINIKSRSLP